MNDQLRKLVMQFAIEMTEIQAADGDLLARVEQFAVDCYSTGRGNRRDDFAAAVMQGMFASGDGEGGMMPTVSPKGKEYPLHIAELSYQYADAMIEAREPKPAAHGVEPETQ